MFVADGLRGVRFADGAVEPCARVFAMGFAGHGQTPFSEVLFEKRPVFVRNITYLANAERVQLLFGDLADTGNLTDIERREKLGFLSGNNVEHAVRLGFS